MILFLLNAAFVVASVVLIVAGCFALRMIAHDKLPPTDFGRAMAVGIAGFALGIFFLPFPILLLGAVLGGFFSAGARKTVRALTASRRRPF